MSVFEHRILHLWFLFLCVQVCFCMYCNLSETETISVTEKEPESEHMAFVTIGVDGDGPRDLSSVCPEQRCLIRTPEKILSAAGAQKRLEISLTLSWFWSGELWIYGHIHVCWGPVDSFRRIASRVTSKWTCIDLHNFAAPEPAAMDSLMLGIYTWYMGPENYEELRLSGHTDVLIPLLPDPYSLPVYFMLYHESPHGAGVECWLQRPYAPSPARMTPQNTEKHVRHYGNHMTRFSFMVEAKSAKSGTYTVSCRGKYYYQPDSAWYPVHVKKEITLRFEKIPRIELVGQTGDTVVFPHTSSAGEFQVNIYSISPIVTFRISRSDGLSSKAELVAEFLSHPYYLLAARYRVSVPWMDGSVTGLYTMVASNKEGQSATHNIQILKLGAMVVLVSPLKMATAEDSSVSFQCVVVTDIPDNTSVHWEFKSQQLPNQTGAITMEELSISGNRKAMELTLPSPALSQSGPYACVAENSFERVEQTVTLYVFPSGEDGYKPQSEGSWIDGIVGANLVLVSERSQIYLAGFVVISGLAAAAVVAGVLVCCRLCCRLGGVRQPVPDSTTNIPPSTKGHFEVINTESSEETQPLLKSEEKSYEKLGQKEDDTDLHELPVLEEDKSQLPGSRRRDKDKAPAMRTVKRRKNEASVKTATEKQKPTDKAVKQSKDDQDESSGGKKPLKKSQKQQI